MTNFNERTNTLLYKNISLTLYSRKGWCCLRVRGELETGTDCYILTQVFLTIAALLSHLGWGCSTVRFGLLSSLGPLSAAGSQFGILSPTDSNSNWFKPSVSWLYFCYFRCSSAFLHRCISWMTARSRVNMLQYNYVWIIWYEYLIP